MHARSVLATSLLVAIATVTIAPAARVAAEPAPPPAPAIAPPPAAPAGAAPDAPAPDAATTARRAAPDWDAAIPSVPDDLALAPGALTPPTIPEDDRRSERTATIAAAVPTAIGAALLGFATLANESDRLHAITGDHLDSTLAVAGVGLLTFGPAAGHVYAGETGHAVLTSAARLGALGLMGVGLAKSICLEDTCPNQSDGPVIMGVGAMFFLGLTIYDVADAHQAAARHNDEVLASMGVVPLIAPSAGGTTAGLAVVGRW